MRISSKSRRSPAGAGGQEGEVAVRIERRREPGGPVTAKVHRHLPVTELPEAVRKAAPDLRAQGAGDLGGGKLDSGQIPVMADPKGGETEFPERFFSRLDPAENAGIDRNGPGHPGGEAGGGRLVGYRQPQLASQGADRLLADPRLEQR